MYLSSNLRRIVSLLIVKLNADVKMKGPVQQGPISSFGHNK